MSSSSQSTSLPPGDDRNLVQVDDRYIAPSFEDRLELFWERYSRVVIIGLVLIVVAILGRALVGWMSARQEQATRVEFATAEDQGRDALLAFATAHPNHVLGGVARLSVADEFYSAGDFTNAAQAYREAATALGDNALAGRALLGAAVSIIQAGETAAGETVLRQMADDVARPAIVRAEAAFHLAVLTRDDGRLDEAKRRVEQVIALGSSGLWGQRAMMLRQQLLATAPTDKTVETGSPAEELFPSTP